LTVARGAVAFGNISQTYNPGINFSAIVLDSVNTRLYWYLPTGEVTYNGTISGAGIFSKGGSSYPTGKLILTKSATHSGATLIYGPLQLGIGASDTVTLTATDSICLYGTASNLIFASGSVFNFDRKITGIGNVSIINGTGIRFTANNTYTGATIMGTATTWGDVYVGNGGSTGTISDSVIIIGILSYLNFYRTDSYTYNGKIFNTISNCRVNKYYNGTLTLTKAQPFYGTVVVYAGTLSLSGAGAIDSCYRLYLNGGNFDMRNAGTRRMLKNLDIEANDTLWIGSYYDTLYVGSASATANDGGGTINGVIAGNTSCCITKRGAATFTIGSTGKINNGVGIVLSSGEWVMSSGATIGTPASTRFKFMRGVLKWGTNNTTDYSPCFSLTSNLDSAIFDLNGNTVTFAEYVPGGTGTSIVKRGTGTLRLLKGSYGAAKWYIRQGYVEIVDTAKIGGDIELTSSGSNLYFYLNRDYTYSGVISGAGKVYSTTSAALYLTGNNTFTGQLGIYYGALVSIGDGNTNGSIATQNIYVENANSLISFGRSDSVVYTGTIYGQGKLGVHGGVLVLNGVNTYTGMTNISGSGTLQLGANGTIEDSKYVACSSTSKFRINNAKKIKGLYVASNGQAILNGNLTIGSPGDVNTGALDVTGALSGAGDIYLYDNINTATSPFTYAYPYIHGTQSNYTGTIRVYADSLQVLGSIANAAGVVLDTAGGRAGCLLVNSNRVLKSLSAVSANNKVIFTSNNSTLTIGTNTTSADGGGVFKGVFQGTGGVIKTGLQTFSMSGTHTATDTLKVVAGGLQMSGTWAGKFALNSGATLDVNGTVNIGGTFHTSGGGNIDMNLTSTPPSLINITGSLYASNQTTLDITANAGNNQILINAGGGIYTNLFTLSMPGYTSTLSSNGTTQLLLNASVTDVTPPVKGSGVTAGVVTSTTVPLTWTAATDAVTPQANLRYYIYQSTSNNITDTAGCRLNGTLLNSGGTLNLLSYTAQNLTPNTTYYFNVVVTDQAGNRTAYSSVSTTTMKAQLAGSVAISGTAVFGQTLTANTASLTSTPSVALGAFTYQWKRGATNIGNASTYSIVAADIGSTITLTVWAANTRDSIVSAPTATIDKASQNAPAAPTMASKTHNSITLNTITNAEYQQAGTATWQPTTTFSGLSAATAYTFYARLAETATHYASPVSPVSAPITTDSTPVAPKVLVSITNPTPITGVANGVAKTAAALGLPAAVTMITNQGSQSAAVTWNVASCAYNPATTTAQTFTVAGTVTLPADVTNPNSIPLSATISVTVDAAPLNPRVISVSVTPVNPSVQKGTSQSFTATVVVADGASQDVTWSINGQNHAQTSIASSGTLIIDASETASTIYVIATADDDNSKTDTSIVTVTNTPITPDVLSVVVTPSITTVQQGNQQQYSVNVSTVGGASTDVTWSVTGKNSANTSIDNYGLLTVGLDETAPFLTITATSVAKSSVSGTANAVIVAAPPQQSITSVSIIPSTLYAVPGNGYSMIENVVAVNGADPSVTWTITGNSDPTTTYSEGWLYVGSNEPNGSSFTVTATSDFDPTKSGTATVIVDSALAPAVTSVKINQQNPSVAKGTTFQFTATVTASGGADETVIWTIENANSGSTNIDGGSGLLTVAANETATSIIVTATSIFEPTVFDKTTVTITGSTDVAAFDKNTIRIYPNPVTTELWIENEGVNIDDKVEIYNTLGQCVYTTTITAQKARIDVSALTSGMYTLKVGTLCTRFAKK
jgi:autotransporter-associated beta strand protein